MIQEQIDNLLTGQRVSLSVHEQWEIAQSLKLLKAVVDALKAERQMLGKGEQNYLPFFEKTQLALDALDSRGQVVDA